MYVIYFNIFIKDKYYQEKSCFEWNCTMYVVLFYKSKKIHNLKLTFNYP